ncbi:DNA-directed RNA polymerase subunit alpha [Trichothermofontia sp.]
MTQFECKVESNEYNYGKFVLEPLERGQGTTVGNALRRVLLSNLEGAAVTAVRIAGVNHEFATIPGVREDVLDILLNMKKVIFRNYSPQPQIGRLRIHGPATVTAGSFSEELPTDLEVINTEHYIATLAAGATLEMEFRVERGHGYRTVDRMRDETTAIDFLQIDAVFMPVTRVNYSVEAIHSGPGIEHDRLLLEVWTNGSYTPKEALSQAAEILTNLFSPLKDISSQAPGPDETKPGDDREHQIPIEELQLSVRAYNCLKRAQINSVADLLDYSQEDLLEIKNFGQKSAEEVIQALQDRLGITLPQEKAHKTG